MQRINRYLITAGSLVLMVLAGACSTVSTEAKRDPLPGWNEGPVKQSIVDFVSAVTNESSPEFVPTNERIAVFDNDGNLWAEKPTYFQLLFIFDRIRAMAPEHPEWYSTQPYHAVLQK